MVTLENPEPIEGRSLPIWGALVLVAAAVGVIKIGGVSLEEDEASFMTRLLEVEEKIIGDQVRAIINSSPSKDETPPQKECEDLNTSLNITSTKIGNAALKGVCAKTIPKIEIPSKVLEECHQSTDPDAKIEKELTKNATRLNKCLKEYGAFCDEKTEETIKEPDLELQRSIQFACE